MVVHLMSTFIYFHLHVHNEKTKMKILSEIIRIIKFSTKIQRIIKNPTPAYRPCLPWRARCAQNLIMMPGDEY